MMVTSARDERVGPGPKLPRLPAREAAHARPEPPTVFAFVNQPDRSAAQRHVKKEFWRKKKAASQNEAKVVKTRALAPRAVAGLVEKPTTSREEIEKPENPTADEEFPLESRMQEQTHLLNMDFDQDWDLSLSPFDNSDDGTAWWDLSRVSAYRHLPAYASLGDVDLDPFNSLTLSREDQGLLHHWVHTYAYQAFGQPSDSNLALLRDLYVPIDLSYKASVQSVLAHSASHLAFLRQEKVSVQALKHKLAAVHMVNEALSNPLTATSDDTFCAVLRLLTYERYWGTEDIWMFHRRGLNQMIKLRGGLSAFANNWRLEARIHIVAQMSVPDWTNSAFKNSNTNSRINIELEPTLQLPHSHFVNFFSDLTPPLQDATHHYPTISRATLLLRSDFESQETSRIMSFFYVAVLSKDSQRSHTDLRWLDNFLATTEHIWYNSVDMLRWLLLQVTGRGVELPRSEGQEQLLAALAEALQSSPWRGLEDRLLVAPGDEII